jgi:hypothetical protein
MLLECTIPTHMIRPFKAASLSAFRWLFARPSLFPLNKVAFKLCLKSLGLLNYETARISGEEWLVRRLARVERALVVLDVGANVGEWSTAIKRACPRATVYAFEPHPVFFQTLQAAAVREHFVALNTRVSSRYTITRREKLHSSHPCRVTSSRTSTESKRQRAGKSRA